jgi:hypothetical protein
MAAPGEQSSAYQLEALQLRSPMPNSLNCWTTSLPVYKKEPTANPSNHDNSKLVNPTGSSSCQMAAFSQWTG